MSDTISPSVTSRVPRGSDAGGRQGGPRRSLPRGDPAPIVYHTTHGQPRAPALSRPLGAPISFIPRLKPWVFQEISINYWTTEAVCRI